MTNIGTATRACAVGVVIAASVLLSGCVSTVSGTAVRAQNAAPIDVPPLTEAKLDDVLLSIGELNGIMGSTQMKVTSELDEMTDHSGRCRTPTASVRSTARRSRCTQAADGRRCVTR